MNDLDKKITELNCILDEILTHETQITQLKSNAKYLTAEIEKETANVTAALRRAGSFNVYSGVPAPIVDTWKDSYA